LADVADRVIVLHEGHATTELTAPLTEQAIEATATFEAPTAAYAGPTPGTPSELDPEGRAS